MSTRQRIGHPTKPAHRLAETELVRAHGLDFGRCKKWHGSPEFGARSASNSGVFTHRARALSSRHRRPKPAAAAFRFRRVKTPDGRATGATSGEPASMILSQFPSRAFARAGTFTRRSRSTRLPRRAPPHPTRSRMSAHGALSGNQVGAFSGNQMGAFSAQQIIRPEA